MRKKVDRISDAVESDNVVPVFVEHLFSKKVSKSSSVLAITSHIFLFRMKKRSVVLPLHFSTSAFHAPMRSDPCPGYGLTRCRETETDISLSFG